MKYLDEYHGRAMQMYKKGMTDPQIADEMFCHRTTIWGWRQKNNLPTKYPPRKSREPEWRAKALEMYAQGERDGAIAKMAGVYPSTICAWRKKRGLKPNGKQGVRADIPNFDADKFFAITGIKIGEA